MDSNTKNGSSQSHRDYQVLIHNVSLYETDDSLVAGAMAHAYRANWKDVKVKERNNETR